MDALERILACAYAGGDPTTLPGVTVEDMRTAVSVLRLDSAASGAMAVSKARELADAIDAFLDAGSA